jgi:AAA+ ATPase superfamily predicted ATPase
MGLKSVVGQAVSGEDFFDRPKEIKKLRKAINSGSHILISAPRRVGKTSLMYYLLDNPGEAQCFVYLITQSINNANDFYKKIHRLIVEADATSDATIRITEWGKKFLRNALDRVKSVGTDEIGKIELREGKEPDYKAKLIKLLKKLDLEGNVLIIMVDEFAQTVENIRIEEGDRQAVRFLQENREITQDRELSKYIRFIYAGSIGLENIVSQLNSVDLINGLYSHKVLPLSREEALGMIQALLENFEFKMTEPATIRLLERVEWFIPFYIQLFMDELAKLHIEEEFQEATEETVERAFHRMLEHRSHFEHWHKRMKKSFKNEQYKLAVEILNRATKQSELSSNEMHDLAVKNGLEEGHKEVAQVLVYDGYINNHEDPSLYRFNSPILKSWWIKNVAN